jgi:anti-sigma factor RsiW
MNEGQVTMSACNSEFAQLVAAYHDGRLDDAASAKVDAHVNSCAVCAAELRELESLSSMLASIPPARLSQIGLARIHKAVDAAVDDERGVLKLARRLSVAAAVVLATATAALMWQSSPTAQASASELPQTWERVAMVGLNDGTATSQQANTVDAEWIVADLSRRSIP